MVSGAAQRVMKAALVAVCATIPFCLIVFHHARAAGGNYSVLLNVSERAFRNNPQLRARPAVRERLVFTNGYDAQYTFFAAFDPLLRRYAHAPDNYSFMMDAAPYRFGRIGHVWLTRLLAGNDWRRYPVTIVWTVLLGCLLSALALSLLAMDAGRSQWWGLLAMVVPGFWQSAQTALPEPIAAACVLFGFWCWRRERWWGAAALLAAAMLVRETSLIAIAGLTAVSFHRGQRVQAASLLGAVLTPYIAWKLYVASVLFSTWGWDVFFYNPYTIAIPFTGMWTAWQKIQAATYFVDSPSVARGAITFALLLCAAAVTAALAVWRHTGAATIIACGYALLAISLSGDAVWTHVGNAQRTSTELFLWLAVAGVTWPSTSARTRGVLTACAAACAAFLLFGAHDAATIRDALWP